MYCFKKVSRLLKKQDYDHVFSQAKKITTSDFTCLYRENKIGHARLGLALSKKIIAKANQRNRIKRLIRETYRLNKRLPAIDIIILARPGIIHVTNSDLVVKLVNTWNKLSILCDVQ